MNIKISVRDAADRIICEASGEDFADLVCPCEYSEGDRIVFELSEKNRFMKIMADDALGEAFVYVTEKMLDYIIPFGEKRVSCSPKVFYGSRHYIYAEAAREDEINAYRNLALNPMDQHRDVPCFPHATANVETRGESVFAAKNAIDGVRANLSHGEWPYESWGINMQDDAAMTIDFGRRIRTGRIVLYTRSDFPHDNWWTNVSFEFDDGEVLSFELEKSCRPHVLDFPEKTTRTIKFFRLIKKADDPSPFPALSQIQVFGCNESL